MTRIVAAALVAAVLAGAAGCGSDAPTAPAVKPPPASDMFDKKAPPRKAKNKADPG